MSCTRCEKDFKARHILQCVCDECLAINPRLTTKERSAMNLWDKFEDFLKVYSAMKKNEWLWIRNTECKYVELRIDMRDGGCIIMNRDSERIGPDRLAYQYSTSNPNRPET